MIRKVNSENKMEKQKAKKEKYISKSFQETQKLGEDFAKQILKEGSKKSGAVIIALYGDLGGGKTTFMQGFAKGLGISEKILSPTFVIEKRFALKNKNLKNLYHIDCYRMKSAKDVSKIGLDKIFLDNKNIVALEWAKKIEKEIKGGSVTSIKFKFIDDNTREIEIY